MGRVGLDSAAWTGGRHTPWTEEPPVAEWSPCPRGCPHPLPVLLTRAAEQWGDVTVTVSARVSSVGQRVGARRLRPERGSSRGRPSPPAAPRPAPGPPPACSVPSPRALCRLGVPPIPATASAPPSRPPATQVVAPTLPLTCTYLEDAVRGLADPSLRPAASSLAGDADARWPRCPCRQLRRLQGGACRTPARSAPQSPRMSFFPN